LPTLVMFPFLTLTYYRLARREERVSLEAFGESYARYMKNTPRFLPKLGNVSAQEADTL
jgi:protein-S-isoprenylcysteine O-methyltransferase Ste14